MRTSFAFVKLKHCLTALTMALVLSSPFFTTETAAAAKATPEAKAATPPKWVKDFVKTMVDEGYKLSLTELGYAPELKEVSKYEITSYKDEKTKQSAKVKCTITAIRTYDEAKHDYKVEKLATAQVEEIELVFSKKGKKVMLESNPPNFILAKKK